MFHTSRSISHIPLDLLTVLKAGIVLCDAAQPEKPVLYINESVCDLLMIKPAEIEGKGFKDLLIHICPDPALQTDIFNAVLDGRDKFFEIENHNLVTPVWIALDIKQIQIGKESYLVCSLENKTEWKMREEQLVQSQRLEGLGQLAGGVAHDFNNLMSIIDGYARIAIKESGDNFIVCDYLRRISDAVSRGASLTRQLLAFGRQSAIGETVADLSHILTDQEAILRTLIDDSVRLTVTHKEPVMIECEPDSVIKILVNLVLNARDAMTQSGGHIHIESGFKNPPVNLLVGKTPAPLGYGYICVQDNGSGMSEKVRQNIFNPFFTTKGQGKGTGLGLSMAYGLMQQMDGLIDVESAPGRGTTFYLYFPLSAKKPVQKIIEKPDDMSAQIMLKGQTIMVAEDETDLLDIIAQMLEQMGMHVIKASNGNDALIKQDTYEGDIDFLLTDVVMPELDGVHLSRLFHSVRPKTQTVFMSGYPSGGPMARINMPDGAHLISKPIAYDKLSYILSQLKMAGDDNDLGRLAGFSEDHVPHA